jgi:hypothetical protein
MNKNNPSEDLTGRILSHEKLSAQIKRGKSGEDNEKYFREDFKSHILDEYKGTAVLYWKGIPCGQGRNAHELLEKASNYYGSSNLTVYNVPQDADGLDKAVANAYIPRI